MPTVHITATRKGLLQNKEIFNERIEVTEGGPQLVQNGEIREGVGIEVRSFGGQDVHVATVHLPISSPKFDTPATTRESITVYPKRLEAEFTDKEPLQKSVIVSVELIS